MCSARRGEHRGAARELHRAFTGSAYAPSVAETNWSKEALEARIDAAMLLDPRRFGVTPERAKLKLEFARVVAAVDSGRMTSVEARLRFDGIIADAEA